MIVAGWICIFVAIVGVATGGVVSGDDWFAVLFWAGLGIFLIYRKKTEEDRILKEKIRQANMRFGNSDFASRLIQDFRLRNWSDLNYNGGGCQVLKDKIVTPHKTYLYKEYGLNNLDKKGCEQLSLFIETSFGRECRTEKIEKYVGAAVGGSYSGYVGSDGSISISRDSGPEPVFLGYRLYSVASLPTKPKPQGKDW